MSAWCKGKQNNTMDSDVDTMTYANVEDMQSHLNTALELNAVLAQNNKMLKDEVRRLKSKNTGEVNVLVYGKKDALEVAVVTDREGAATWRAALDQFDQHRRALKDKGIVYQQFVGVEVNEEHSTPFKSEPRCSASRT